MIKPPPLQPVDVRAIAVADLERVTERFVAVADALIHDGEETEFLIGCMVLAIDRLRRRGVGVDRQIFDGSCPG